MDDIREAARDLDAKMQQATGETLASLPSAGLAPGESPRRGPRARTSLGGGGAGVLSEATGRLILDAIRAGVEVLAAAVRTLCDSPARFILTSTEQHRSSGLAGARA